MIYFALGDSISIDDYTGVAGGGAASQFARLIAPAEFHDLTRDGATTAAVLASLDTVTFRPGVVTLTAGGNDLLQMAYAVGRQSGALLPATLAQAASPILDNLRRIADRLSAYGCPVILNTIYDPTDGADALADRLGVPPSWRTIYNQVNDGIHALAQEHGFLLGDLEALFHGHGITSPEPWFVMEIEPDLAGATAIAHEWYRLYHAAPSQESKVR